MSQIIALIASWTDYGKLWLSRVEKRCLITQLCVGDYSYGTGKSQDGDAI